MKFSSSILLSSFLLLSSCASPGSGSGSGSTTSVVLTPTQQAAVALALTIADAEVAKYESNPKNSAASVQKLNLLVVAAKAAVTAYMNSQGGQNVAEQQAATAAITAVTQFILNPPANPPQI